MQTSNEEELWGITNIRGLVFSSRENAEVVKKFMLSKVMPQYVGRQEKKYYVHRIYKDSGVKKIKEGAKFWKVQMARDGSVEQVKEEVPSVGKFGFTNPGIYQVDLTKKVKVLVYSCLALSQEEAIKKADEWRIKHLLDDYWFKFHDNYSF